MDKKVIYFVIAIILVVVALFGTNAILKNKNVEVADDPVVETPDVINSIFVPEQAEGNQVFIRDTSSVDSGFVVIHKTEEDEIGGTTTGEIIGSSELIPSGNTQNFVIELTEETTEGDVLMAMLHKDDGDGVFDPALDLPVSNVEVDSTIVATKFGIVSEGALENEFKF